MKKAKMARGQTDTAQSPNEAGDEKPPVMKSWRQLHIFVLGSLLLWILLFLIFTEIYR